MRSLAEKLPQSVLGVAEKCQASDANANCQLPNCRGEIRDETGLLMAAHTSLPPPLPIPILGLGA